MVGNHFVQLRMWNLISWPYLLCFILWHLLNDFQVPNRKILLSLDSCHTSSNKNRVTALEKAWAVLLIGLCRNGLSILHVVMRWNTKQLPLVFLPSLVRQLHIKFYWILFWHGDHNWWWNYKWQPHCNRLLNLYINL
jgi:hypothetical protein